MDRMKFTRKKLYSWLMVIALVFSVIQPVPGSVREAAAEIDESVTVTFRGNTGKVIKVIPGEESEKVDELEGTLAKIEEENKWDSIEMPQAERRGYTFEGWWTAADGGSYMGDAGDDYTVTKRPNDGSVSLYAHWNPIQFDDSRLVVKSVDTEGQALVYDGTVKVPQVTVYDEEGTKLIQDEDYIITYPDGHEEGYIDATEDAQVVIKGKAGSAYEGRTPITGDFEIAKRKVTITPLSTQITKYVEELPDPYAYELAVDGLTSDYVAVNDNMNAVISVDGQGKMTFVNGALKKDSPSDGDVGTYEYDISEFESNADISKNYELSLAEDSLFTVNKLSFNDDEDTATFEVTLNDDPEENLLGNAAEGYYYVYNGSRKSPQIVVTRKIEGQADKVLEEVTDYTVASEGRQGTDIDEYTITITGTGDYEGTLTCKWNIVKKTLPVYDYENPAGNKYQILFDGNDAVFTDNENRIITGTTYDGNPHKVAVDTVDSEDNKNEEDKDIRIQYKKAPDEEYTDEIPSFTEAGTYTVYYKITTGNHYNALVNDIEDCVKFTIARRPVSLKVLKSSKTYGENDPEYTYKITAGNLVGDYEIQGFQAAVTREAGAKQDVSRYDIDEKDTWKSFEAVGTHELSINVSYLNTQNKNYVFTDATPDETYLTIKQKRINVTANSYHVEYLDDAKTLEYTITDENGEFVLPFEDTLTGDLKCVDKAGDAVGSNTAAGTYPIAKADNFTAEANPNYKITFVKGQYVISPRNIESLLDRGELTVNYQDSYGPIFAYDDTNQSPKFDVAQAVTGSGMSVLDEGTDYTLQGDIKKKDIGYYDVDIVGKGNFEGTISRKWLIAVQYGEKTTTYNGKEQPYESVATASKLKFPEGSTVKYNVYTNPTDEQLDDNVKDADYKSKYPYWSSIDGLSFPYNYVISKDENDVETFSYPNAVTGESGRPNFRDAGTYYVYYEVTPAGEGQEPVYFAYKLTIEKKQVALVAVDNEKVYRAKDPKFGMKVIDYTSKGSDEADLAYYKVDEANAALQSEESALCSGDKIDGYKVVHKEEWTGNEDCDKYVLKVVRDEESISTDSPAFDDNYEVKYLCAGTFTINKAPFDITANEFYAASPAPYASKDRAGTKTITELRDLMTGEKAQELGFKELEYLDDNEPPAPLGITVADTNDIIKDDTEKVDAEGKISFELAVDSKADKEATITVMVRSRNYVDIQIPVTITTKKNEGKIEVLDNAVLTKPYDGAIIPIEVDDNYKTYFDIDGMKYDPAAAPDPKYVYDEESGADALGYNLEYSYEKIIDESDSENILTEALGSAPKNVGKYRVTVSMEENPEYTAASKTFDYEITKKTVSAIVPNPDNRAYNGSVVADIPGFTISDTHGTVDGESFTITGLKGTYQAVEGTAAKDVRLDNTGAPTAKPVSLESNKVVNDGEYTVTGYGGALFDNYDITFGNADNITGVITKKAVNAEVPTPAPRDYDGTDVASIPEFSVNTGVGEDENEEVFTITGLKGAYQTYSGIAGKDVLLDGDVAAGKPVVLEASKAEAIDRAGYTVAGSSDAVLLSNYTISFANAFNGDTPNGDYKGIILKKNVNVVVPSPKPRDYNGKDYSTIDEFTVTDAEKIGTEVTGEVFKISGLTVTYQETEDASGNTVSGKDVLTGADGNAAAKPVKVNNPYDGNVAEALKQDYTITIPAGSGAALKGGSTTVLANYDITFVDEGLEGIINKKQINVTLPDPNDKPYDGNSTAVIDDVNVTDAEADNGTGVTGETFTITGITGEFQKYEDEEYSADANVAYEVDGTTVASKKVKLNNPYNGDTISAEAAEAYKISNSTAELVNGSDKDFVNYTINFTNEYESPGVPGLSATISKRPVEYTISAEDKPYDGNADAELKYVFDDLVAGEDVDITGYTGTFDADADGIGGKEAKDVYCDTDTGELVVKAKNVTLELNGNTEYTSVDPATYSAANENTDVKNYEFSLSDDNKDGDNLKKLSAKIEPRELTFVTEIDDKTYDGNTTATVSSKQIYHEEKDAQGEPTMVPGTGVANESATIQIDKADFDSKDVAYSDEANTEAAEQNVIVVCEGEPYVTTGTNKYNYKFILGEDQSLITTGDDAGKIQFTGKAKITPKELSVSYATEDKLYDGTNDADVTATVDTGITGESITISGVKGSFVSKDAGEHIKVEIDSDSKSETPVENTTKVSNYKITYPDVDTAGADIIKRKVRITASADPATGVQYGTDINLNTLIEYQNAKDSDVYVSKEALGENYKGDVVNNIEAVVDGTADVAGYYVPGSYDVKVKDIAEGTYPNYIITPVKGTIVIVKADGPAAPAAADITIMRPVDNDTNNGNATIAESALDGKVMQYMVTGGTWTDVPDSGVIGNLGVTTLSLRYKETTTHEAGEELTLQIAAKGSQAAPAGTLFTVHKATKADAADGSIEGFNDSMEYSYDGKAPWTSAEDITSITGRKGNTSVYVRYAETNDKRPGEALKLDIGVKQDEEVPDTSDITIVKATSDSNDDGKMRVPASKTGLEYSVDNGINWTDVVPTEVTGLPVGAVLVRTKARNNDDYNPSKAVKLIVGNLEDDKTAAKEELDVVSEKVKSKINADELTYLEAADIQGYKDRIGASGEENSIVAKGYADINACTTVEDVVSKKNTAITSINSVYAEAAAANLTTAKNKAVEAVNSAVASAKTVISNLKNLSDTDKAVYTGRIGNADAEESIAGKGISSIEASADTDKAEDEKEKTIEDINAEVEKAKLADLEKAKENAKQDIISSADAAKTSVEALTAITAEEKNAYVDQISNIADNYDGKISVINDPAKLADVATVKTEALEKINAVKTAANQAAALAEARVESKEEINTKKNEVVTSLNSLDKLTDSEKSDYKLQAADIASDAVVAINAAKLADISGIAGKAKADLENLKNAAALKNAKNGANEVINTAAEGAKDIINGLDNLSDEEKQDYIAQITDNASLTPVEQAETPEAAGEAATSAKTAIEQIVEDAKNTDIANAKQAASDVIVASVKEAADTIGALRNLSDADKKAYLDAIGSKDTENTLAGDASREVTDAETSAVAKEAADTCKEAISSRIADAVKADFDKANQAAKDIADNAKKDAVKAVDALTSLTDRDKEYYKNLINAKADEAIRAVEAADTLEAISEAVKDIESDINAQVAAAKKDNLANAKAEAKSALESKRAEAAEAIEKYDILTEEESDKYVEDIDKAIDEAITAIDAITSPDNLSDVTDKKDTASASVDKIVNDAGAYSNIPDVKSISVVESAGEDGVINGVNDTMEYSTDNGETWNKVEEGAESVSGLAPGTVQVRYAATEEKPASKSVDITIPKKAEPTAAPTAVPTAVPTPAPAVSSAAPVAESPLSASQLNALALNQGLKVSQTGKKINVAWGKVDGADGYEVYVQYCGKSFSNFTKVSKNKTKLTVTKVNGKALNLKKNYKVRVRAYKMENGKKVVLGKTIDAHIVGKNNKKYTNVKSVVVNKSSVTLAAGKTFTVKARTVLVDSSKKPLSNAHAKELRYASDNPNIATVDSKGKITAKSAGTCTVFVYARNGNAKKVKVTVQ